MVLLSASRKKYGLLLLVLMTDSKANFRPVDFLDSPWKPKTSKKIFPMLSESVETKQRQFIISPNKKLLMANTALKFSAWKATETSHLEEKKLVPFQPFYPSTTWLLSLHNMASSKNKIYEM